MDILNDNLYATLLHINRKCEVPDYVKTASPLTKEAAAALPGTLFADRVNRRYPIDSKADTWLSAAYFAKTAEDDGYSSDVVRDLVERTIKLAADKYGIRPDVDKVMGELRQAPIVKKASDNEDNYGWPSEKKYPMFDEHGVKLACSYFEDNAFNYPPKMRRTIAERIFQKCAEYGIEPNDTVRQEAGQGFNLREDMAMEVYDRMRALRPANVKVASALGTALRSVLLAPMERYPSYVEKFASILDDIDEKFGFDNDYGTRFRSPMEIFHARNIKEAQNVVEDTVMLGPNCFSVKKLASLPVEVFTDALGDDFGSTVKSAEQTDEIDVQKLGPALKGLSEPNRGALYRSIVVYMG